MSNTRVSYEEWLKSKGVIGKNENADIAAYRTQPVINYLFSSQDKAEKFMAEFSISTVLKLDLVSGELAVIVDANSHKKIITSYELNVGVERSEQDIRNQLAAIDARLDFFKNHSRITSRLTDLNKLARNLDISMCWDFRMTSAFIQSLENYLALYMNLFDNAELSRINDHITLLKKDRDGWSTHWSTELDRIKDYLEDRLFANRLPQIIDKKFDEETSLLLDGEKANPSNKTKPRKQRFYPDANGLSETDEIYFNTGGAIDHTAITKIWKRGVNSEGTIISTAEKPHHYEFFETEYNAGYGSDFTLDSPWTIWSTSTKPIVFPRQKEALVSGTQPYNLAMREAIFQLIKAEKMLKVYENNSPNLAKWKKIRDSYLGSRNINLSKKGIVQRTGNCTVMSWKALTDDYLGNLSEEHFLYAKMFDEKSTLAELQLRKKEVQAELDRLYPSKEASQAASAESNSSANNSSLRFFSNPLTRRYASTSPTRGEVIESTKHMSR